MKLAILSRNSKLYSTRRLVEAARDEGHTVRVLDPLRCYMRIACDGFDMHYKGRPLAGYDAVIPRIGASVTRYGTAVLRQFELMGTSTPNPSDAILRARDKLALLGPPPHVIKLTESAQGAGVILTEKLSASKGVTEALRGLYANFLVQEFIAEARGADVRCFVVGDRVIAAMRRQAPAGEFRSNLHRGGSAAGVRPSRAECEVAIRATRVLGLGVAGVDLIRSDRGPLVLEVNASPGLEGIEAASGKDVAGEIVRFVAKGGGARRTPRRLRK